MARWIKTASVLMEDLPQHGAADAYQKTAQTIERHTQMLSGLGVDLVVFSEMVEATAQRLDQAEQITAPGPMLLAYQRLAASESCTVAGSVKLTDGQHVYNSIAYIGPEGDVLGTYHKCFLTKRELESGLSPGHGPAVVETPAGRLGGVICFDLNFPELCEQYARLQPDILTFPSAYHGGLAQAWWAYRCRSFFVSSLQFHGGGVVNPFGQPLALTDCYTSHAMTSINLDRAMVHLDYNRDKFLDIRRQYGDRIDLHVPANVGSAMITSRDQHLTAMDVVREYDLELLDDYFAASRASNAAARDSRSEAGRVEAPTVERPSPVPA